MKLKTKWGKIPFRFTKMKLGKLRADEHLSKNTPNASSFYNTLRGEAISLLHGLYH